MYITLHFNSINEVVDFLLDLEYPTPAEIYSNYNETLKAFEGLDIIDYKVFINEYFLTAHITDETGDDLLILPSYQYNKSIIFDSIPAYLHPLPKRKTA